MEHYGRHRCLLTPFFLDEPAPLLRRLAEPHWQVLEAAPAERQDVSVQDRTVARIGDVHAVLAENVHHAAAAGDVVVNIGADCCQPIAVLAGLRRAGLDPIVLWLDAHGDFNTWETSPSGFIGGMPLAMLVGRGDQRLLQRVSLAPIPERDVVLCDARDVDPEEARALQRSAVTHVEAVEDLLSRLPAERPIYVHLDFDILDATEAPAMLYPVSGGPSVAALTRAAAGLAATGRIAAISVTAWEPGRDADGSTERACLRVLRALIGQS